MFLHLLFLSAVYHATNAAKSVKEVSGQQEATVEEKGLVTSQPKWSEIVEHQGGYTTIAGPSNLTTLAYVTPWNSHGYDVANIQRARFSHVSPVWFQLKRHSGGSGWTVEGQHDVDAGWIKDVRGSGPHQTKVVPRILFEGWQEHHYSILVQVESFQSQLLGDLLKLIKKHKLDGLVLEVWSQLPSRQLFETMPGVIATLCKGLRKAGHTCILVVPPPVYEGKRPGMFVKKQFKALAPHVDFFSLMTYDFSSFQRPGANSPLWWVEECVEALSSLKQRSKLLVGLNLYGLAHSPTGGRYVLGRDVTGLLRDHRPSIMWDERDQEHYFEYRSQGRHTVFYPTLHSIARRVALARQMGVGVSLWEIGQGMDYFYDLLY